MIPSRIPNVVYSELDEYHIDRFDRCGYFLASDEQTLYDTFERALAKSPEGMTDAIFQTFNSEDRLVAKCLTGGEWQIESNADSVKVAKFEFDMERFPRCPSLNKEYTVKKGKFPRKTLTTYARKFKEYLKKECFESYHEIFGYVSWLDTVNWKAQKAKFPYRFQIDMIFYIKGDRVFNRRDVSNMVKIPEDALADVWGINDARHMRLNVEKREAPGGAEVNEHLQVRIKLLRTV